MFKKTSGLSSLGVGDICTISLGGKFLFWLLWRSRYQILTSAKPEMPQVSDHFSYMLGEKGSNFGSWLLASMEQDDRNINYNNGTTVTSTVFSTMHSRKTWDAI